MQHVYIVHHVRMAYSLPRQAQHNTNLANLLTCLLPPFIVDSKTSHVRHLLTTLTYRSRASVSRRARALRCLLFF